MSGERVEALRFVRERLLNGEPMVLLVGAALDDAGRVLMTDATALSLTPASDTAARRDLIADLDRQIAGGPILDLSIRPNEG